MRMKGKTAIVTGAASGIGWATAALLLAEGAAVLAVDVQPGAPDGCQTLIADVTDEAAAEQAVAALGQVDVLVTAAGISRGKPAGDTAMADWDAVMATNVTGTFVWIRACLRPMVQAGRGSIVTVASQLARAGGRNNAAYVTSKGAVIALTKSGGAGLRHRGRSLQRGAARRDRHAAARPLHGPRRRPGRCPRCLPGPAPDGALRPAGGGRPLHPAFGQ